MKVVAFKAPDTHQAACMEILEAALEECRAGRMVDVAVCMALRTDNGNREFHHAAYGEGAYSQLVAAVASLAFELQYRHFRAD